MTGTACDCPPALLPSCDCPPRKKEPPKRPGKSKKSCCPCGCLDPAEPQLPDEYCLCENIDEGIQADVCMNPTACKKVQVDVKDTNCSCQKQQTVQVDVKDTTCSCQQQQTPYCYCPPPSSTPSYQQQITCYCQQTATCCCELPADEQPTIEKSRSPAKREIQPKTNEPKASSMCSKPMTCKYLQDMDDSIIRECAMQAPCCTCKKISQGTDCIKPSTCTYMEQGKPSEVSDCIKPSTCTYMESRRPTTNTRSGPDEPCFCDRQEDYKSTQTTDRAPKSTMSILRSGSELQPRDAPRKRLCFCDDVGQEIEPPENDKPPQAVNDPSQQACICLAEIIPHILNFCQAVNNLQCTQRGAAIPPDSNNRLAVNPGYTSSPSYSSKSNVDPLPGYTSNPSLTRTQSRQSASKQATGSREGLRNNRYDKQSVSKETIQSVASDKTLSAKEDSIIPADRKITKETKQSLARDQTSPAKDDSIITADRTITKETKQSSARDQTSSAKDYSIISSDRKITKETKQSLARDQTSPAKDDSIISTGGKISRDTRQSHAIDKTYSAKSDSVITSNRQISKETRQSLPSDKRPSAKNSRISPSSKITEESKQSLASGKRSSAKNDARSSTNRNITHQQFEISSSVPEEYIGDSQLRLIVGHDQTPAEQGSTMNSWSLFGQKYPPGSMSLTGALVTNTDLSERSSQFSDLPNELHAVKSRENISPRGTERLSRNSTFVSLQKSLHSKQSVSRQSPRPKSGPSSQSVRESQRQSQETRNILYQAQALPPAKESEELSMQHSKTTNRSVPSAKDSTNSRPFSQPSELPSVKESAGTTRKPSDRSSTSTPITSNRSKQLDTSSTPSKNSRSKQLDASSTPSKNSGLKQSDASSTPSKDGRSKQSEASGTPSKDSRSKQSDASSTPSKDSRSKQLDASSTPSKNSGLKQSDASNTPSQDNRSKQSDASSTPSKNSPSKQSDASNTPSKDSRSKQSDASSTPSKNSRSKQSDASSTPSKNSRSKQSEASLKRMESFTQGSTIKQKDTPLPAKESETEKLSSVSKQDMSHTTQNVEVSVKSASQAKLSQDISRKSPNGKESGRSDPQQRVPSFLQPDMSSTTPKESELQPETLDTTVVQHDLSQGFVINEESATNVGASDQGMISPVRGSVATKSYLQEVEISAKNLENKASSAISSPEEEIMSEKLLDTKGSATVSKAESTREAVDAAEAISNRSNPQEVEASVSKIPDSGVEKMSLKSLNDQESAHKEQHPEDLKLCECKRLSADSEGPGHQTPDSGVQKMSLKSLSDQESADKEQHPEDLKICESKRISADSEGPGHQTPDSGVQKMSLKSLNDQESADKEQHPEDSKLCECKRPSADSGGSVQLFLISRPYENNTVPGVNQRIAIKEGRVTGYELSPDQIQAIKHILDG